MPASVKPSLKLSLPILLVAMVFMAPAAYAKKDLFGSDPAGKAAPTEQLVEQPAVPTETLPAQTLEPVQPTVITEKEEKKEKESFFETQFGRLKKNLTNAKNDLFGNKDASKKDKAAPKPAQVNTESEHSSEQSSSSPPVISPTEAAQRAQTVATGQVMNVRKYQEEEKTLYAVKLLQKNGRMKTVNINAITGDVVEEAPQ